MSLNKDNKTNVTETGIIRKSGRMQMFSLGLFIAIGLALGGYFISQTLYNAKVALNTAEVKGLAERKVTSDHAHWTISFSATGNTREEIPALYKKAEDDQKIIVNLLKENGIKESEIIIGVIDYNYHEFRNENKILVDQKHQLLGSITVETDNVNLISKVRTNINKLIAQGIDVQNGLPKYRFTKLNDIKPEMLMEATKNARLVADEFAKNAGASVGGIRSAKQGGFNIRDAGEEYGDTRKIQKEVRVVTTITFYLTD